MLGLPVRDVTSGYRAYRADALRALDLESMTTTGFGFQIDATDRARRAGAVIREVPIVFRDRTAGESKMSRDIVREALLMVTGRAFRKWFGPRRHTPDVGAMEPVRVPSSAELVLARPSTEVMS
jgi:dolichol-phosphate mannosyltransferase